VSDPAGAANAFAVPALPALRFPEIRGLWIVRGTLASPEGIRDMVARADAAGFNTLLVQIRGRGDAYYDSRWEPASHVLPSGDEAFDPLTLVIQEARIRGMAVHGWVNTHLVASALTLPTDPSHMVNARPDLLAVPLELADELHGRDPFEPSYRASLVAHARANPDGVEGLYSSPSSPEVQEHVYSVWMDLAERYDLDGLHFDYVRYPSPAFDYSTDALRRFRTWMAPQLEPEEARRLDSAAGGNPLAWVEAHPEAWDRFRRSQITSLVERIYVGVKKRRPELLVSAAVFANVTDAYQNRFQDWRGWLRAGIVDVVAPMAYTPDDARFRSQVQTALDAAGGQAWRVWPGIGAYQNTFEGTVAKGRIARDLGTRGFLLFSYDWMIQEGAARGPGGTDLLQAVGAALEAR
jgi:uncharacterized lipoprotein YddW (UPF0748 family)